MTESPLLRFLFDHRKSLPGLVVILGISLLSGVLKMLAASYWGRAVDFGVAGMMREMLFCAGLMALFVLLDCARTALHYHVLGRITENMFLGVRAKAFAKLTHGDSATLENKFRTGDMAVRLNNDIHILNVFVSAHVCNYSRQFFQALFALVSCVFMSWQLSLAYLVVLPVTLWAVKTISKPILAQSKKAMDDQGSSMNVAADAISGALTIKAFGAEEEMTARFTQGVESSCTQEIKSQALAMKMTGVKYAANVIQIMSLFLIGSWLVSSGQLSVGTFIAFVALSNYITEVLTETDYMLSVLRRASASAQRYYEAIDIPDEWSGPVRKPVSGQPCRAEKLSFSYESGGRQALKELTLEIPAGRKVAIVGTSGGGKSTLLKLLCRFYLPVGGSLKLFGAEAADWESDALRSQLSLVTQDPMLFDGTIYENVSFGRPGATRAECETALKDAGLWSLVESFPEGIDHPIGEGGQTLSGGQKQRLCIARAMVKQAPLVLLDEATSALDLQTEREVQESLDRLLQGKTAVIIAHRLSTVQNADYIYFVHEGRIAEEGTPAELLRRRGRYYEMCRLQDLAGDGREGESE